jgi:type IV pilus biogenesis protein CpaD/CtpE
LIAGTSACATSGNPSIMKILRLTVRPVLAAVACASIAACANNPPRQTDMDYRSRPSSTTQRANTPPGSSDQRLTIQSGEGEKLNLPWFVRDTQEWINSN